MENHPSAKILCGYFNYDSLYNEYLDYKAKYSGYNFPNTLPVERSDSSEIVGFGRLLHPVFKIQKFHNGIDIPAKRGEIIISTIEGKVIEKKEIKTKFGNYIIISTQDSTKIVLAHLDTIYVNAGEKIAIEQAIGEVGNSGMSTGMHLHYEVWQNENPINPLFTVWDSFKRELIEKIYKWNIVSYD